MKNYTLIAKQLPGGSVVTGEINCWFGSCPAVIKTEGGKALVVGRLLTKEEHADVANTGMIAFHDGEVAVEVCSELLQKAASGL